jgi:hypothetical protein
MVKRFLVSVCFIPVLLWSQTYLTVPQNVWRIKLGYEDSKGNWKGHNGLKGWRDFAYSLDSSQFTLSKFTEQHFKISHLNLDYGFTNRTTVYLEIPMVRFGERIITWQTAGDTSTATLDSLLGYFYPTRAVTSGLGDISLGFHYLLMGKPAWSQQGNFSVYTGFQMTMPFGKRLIAYDKNAVDKNGLPKQFSQLPLGTGLTEWQLRLFGEFYTIIYERLINVNWGIRLSRFSREMVNPPITFLWTSETDPDSIAASIGETVLFQDGNRAWGEIDGKLELWPNRFFISVGMSWEIRGRAHYFSENHSWNQWMSHRKNYDTRSFISRQQVRLTLMNADPLKKIGPLPFELEIGLSWYVPFLTYQAFGYRTLWLTWSSYFQGW